MKKKTYIIKKINQHKGGYDEYINVESTFDSDDDVKPNSYTNTNSFNKTNSIYNDDTEDTDEYITNKSDSYTDNYKEEKNNYMDEYNDEIEELNEVEDYTSKDKMYGHPKVDDPNLQSNIYKKREFYYYKLPERPDLTNYNEIAEYRKKICDPSGGLLEHQAMLSNFINPDTPYKGVLVFHGTGTGKCLYGDSLVLVNDNKYLKIQDLWSYYTTEIIEDNDGGQWSKPFTNLTVQSLNSKNKIVIGKVKHLYRECISTFLTKIILENNSSVIKTSVHKLYNGSCWISNVKIGDNIAIYDKGILNYSRVKFIDYKKYCGYVYDLEVEEYHNFVSNNIFCHNTCVGVAIGEKFKPMVQRYGTPIYILVPGPLLKENWKKSFLDCTGDTYLQSKENLIFINDDEKEKVKNAGIQQASQYYKIMSYKSFQRRVLGEKIVENKTIEGNKIKVTYKKSDEGGFERDVNMDRIHHLNNTLLIADEAHNLTGNSFGEALTKIIKASTNLKIVLLSATPMKNLADDIVELLNFIRPQDAPIKRDIIFTAEKNHLMQFKSGGLEYLKKMAQGYISHLRGADPMTFAEKIEMGEKPKGLLFTRISRCEMKPFQRATYDEAIKEKNDSLNRKSEDIANFVFPALDDTRKKIIGVYSKEGLNSLKNQLKTHREKINKMIATDILNLKQTEQDQDFININENTKNITGAILKKEYLENFSTKFYRALIDIEENLFYNNNTKESRTGFCYSNLVKIGIEIFQEVLIQNGYLEYDVNNSNYLIKDTTICYFCGKTHKEHNNQILPEHIFKPATFVVVTGTSSEEGVEASIPEDKQKILNNVFSNLANKEGENIKLVLGSKVMNEGLSLKNVRSVHILDVYFNFGRVDQVVGRAIRWCSHYKLMSEENPYPKVKLYKYSISLGNNSKELSTEEDLYYKAEQKYILIKKIERCLKEVAIDCALNQQGNMFKEEIVEFNKCIKPNDNLLKLELKEGDNSNNICPSKCDFTDCLYKCHDSILNSKYYDPQRNIYKKLSKNNLDYSTFTTNLAKTEIDYAKRKIKELYMTGYVYNLKTITDYVYESYNKDKKDLFDEFFVQKALDQLIPVSENDFNNYKDILIDKSYRAGYLIYLDGYYLFQPFDEKENVPMYYRTKYQYNYQSKLGLQNYILTEKKGVLLKDLETNEDIDDEVGYNFDDVMDYYDERKEHYIVGIIDKEPNKQKNDERINDIFKIREKREKILDKKRATGIPSLKGAVCATSKQKEYLIKIAKNLDIKHMPKDLTRDNLCNTIMDKLIELEKYSKGKDKMTYIMVPSNHPKYIFPLNLEDRLEFIKNKVSNILNQKIIFKETVDNKKNTITLSFKLTQKPTADDIYKLENIYNKDVNKLVTEMWDVSKDKLSWTTVLS
jgi:superfamily II DNA or RNA helicase